MGMTKFAIKIIANKIARLKLPDLIIKELDIGQNRAYDLFMAMIEPLGISREEAGVKVKALIKQNANTSGCRGKSFAIDRYVYEYGLGTFFHPY